MNVDIVSEVRTYLKEVITDQACLPIIWDVAPSKPIEPIYCTVTLRDDAPKVIATCGDKYEMEEAGSIVIVVYTKRGEGDGEMRKHADIIRNTLSYSKTANVEFDDIIQDVPFSAEQSDIAIYMRLNYRAYTTRQIN